MFTIFERKYTVIPGTCPINYGNSCFEVLHNRALYLVGFVDSASLRKVFNRKIEVWKENRSNNGLSLKGKNHHTIATNFPFGRLTLADAIAKKCITFKNNEIKPYFPALEKIHAKFLKKELLKEILLTSSISFAKTIFDLFYTNTTDIYIALQWAALLGIIKGLVKAASDGLSSKNIPLKILLWKCLAEIFSEIATEFTFYFSNLFKYIPLQSALKGFWKYLFDQIVGGYYFLMTLTELGLEMFKAGFKGTLRDKFSTQFASSMPFLRLIDSAQGLLIGQLAGSLTGAMLAVGLLNVFIEQCTLYMFNLK